MRMITALTAAVLGVATIAAVLVIRRTEPARAAAPRVEERADGLRYATRHARPFTPAGRRPVTLPPAADPVVAYMAPEQPEVQRHAHAMITGQLAAYFTRARLTGEQRTAVLRALWDAQEAFRVAREEALDLRYGPIRVRAGEDSRDAREAQEAQADAIDEDKYAAIDADLRARLREVLTTEQVDAWELDLPVVDIARVVVTAEAP